MSHPYLKELVEFPKRGQRIERYFWDENENLLAIENKAQQLSARINLYRQILTREPQYFLLDQKDNSNNIKINIFRYTKDIILSGSWMKTHFHCYDGKYGGNILVFGQTGCVKTTFIPNTKHCEKQFI